MCLQSLGFLSYSLWGYIFSIKCKIANFLSLRGLQSTPPPLRFFVKICKNMIWIKFHNIIKKKWDEVYSF